MKLTEEQKIAVTQFLQEKIEYLMDYQLINPDLICYVFEKITDYSQNNAFVFLQQLQDKIVLEKTKWDLPPRHYLVDPALKPNVNAELFNLFALIHYKPDLPGGEYSLYLQREFKIKLEDVETRDEIKSLFKEIWQSDPSEAMALELKKITEKISSPEAKEASMEMEGSILLCLPKKSAIEISSIDPGH